jgi:hypothetical protein
MIITTVDLIDLLILLIIKGRWRRRTLREHTGNIGSTSDESNSGFDRPSDSIDNQGTVEKTYTSRTHRKYRFDER